VRLLCPISPYCLVSHIRRVPEAETKYAAGASEAAVAKHQKQQKPCTGQDGPAAEALLEGAEYDAETGDAAEASEAAAVTTARVRPPRPTDWERWQGVSGGTGNSKEGGHVSASAQVMVETWLLR